MPAFRPATIVLLATTTVLAQPAVPSETTGARPEIQEVAKIDDGKVMLIAYRLEKRVRVVVGDPNGSNVEREETYFVHVPLTMEVKGRFEWRTVGGEPLDAEKIGDRVENGDFVVVTHGAPLDERYRSLFKGSVVNLVVGTN